VTGIQMPASSEERVVRQDTGMVATSEAGWPFDVRRIADTA
jgi:hypothetical protein